MGFDREKKRWVLIMKRRVCMGFDHEKKNMGF